MTDYRSIEDQLRDTFSLRRRPVAVTFRESPPAGVAKFTGTEPSGCSFWRVAAGGRTFYTVPSDHYNCAIGSHTHNIPLPARPRGGAPPDARVHDRHRLRADGGGSRASRACPRRPAPSSTRRSATRRSIPTWCSSSGRPAPAHAAPGGGPPGRPPGAGALHGAPDLHGAARRPRRTACWPAPAASATACTRTSATTSCTSPFPGRTSTSSRPRPTTIAAANAALADYHRGRRQALSTE